MKLDLFILVLSLILCIFFFYRKKSIFFLSIIFSGIERIFVPIGFSLSPVVFTAISSAESLVVSCVSNKTDWSKYIKQFIQNSRSFIFLTLTLFFPAFISGVFSFERGLSIKSSLFIFLYVIFIFANLLSLKKYRNIDTVFKLLIFSTSIYSIYGIIQYIRYRIGLYPDVYIVKVLNKGLSPLSFVTAGTKTSLRPNSLFSDVNTFAGYLALFIPIEIYYIYSSIKKTKENFNEKADYIRKNVIYLIFFSILVFINAISLILTESKSIIGAILFGVIWICIFYIIKFPGNIKKFLQIIGIMIIAIAIIIFAFRKDEMKLYKKDVLNTFSYHAHAMFIEVSYLSFSTHAITGTGIGTFYDYYNSLVKSGEVKNYGQADYPPLEARILAEEGLIGFAGFILFISFLYYKIIKIGDNFLSLFTGLGLSFLLGMNLFHAYFFLFFSSIYISLVLYFSQCKNKSE